MGGGGFRAVPPSSFMPSLAFAPAVAPTDTAAFRYAASLDLPDLEDAVPARSPAQLLKELA